MGALSDAWGEWRNRLLSNPAFRRRAQRLPLTRGVARRRAADLFDLTAGFVNSQILAACLEIDLLQRLEHESATTAALAGEFEIPAGRLLHLLEAAASLALIEKRGRDRWGMGPQGAVLNSDAGLMAMSRHHHALYQDLADPVALLRGTAEPTRLAQLWPYAGHQNPASLEDADTRRYTALMADSQAMVAEQVLGAFDFSPFRALLDVGGGSGAFAAAVGAAHPSLDLAVFDLPGVADQARDRFREAGLAERARFHGGDFHNDTLPRGHDLVSLVRIVHDHDDDPASALLRSAFDALDPGGRLLVAEPMITRSGGRTLGNYFRFYLMAMGSGRPRAPRELEGIIRAAGFQGLTRHGTDLPLICSVISARKPAQ